MACRCPDAGPVSPARPRRVSGSDRDCPGSSAHRPAPVLRAGKPWPASRTRRTIRPGPPDRRNATYGRDIAGGHRTAVRIGRCLDPVAVPGRGEGGAEDAVWGGQRAHLRQRGVHLGSAQIEQHPLGDPGGPLVITESQGAQGIRPVPAQIGDDLDPARGLVQHRAPERVHLLGVQFEHRSLDPQPQRAGVQARAEQDHLRAAAVQGLADHIVEEAGAHADPGESVAVRGDTPGLRARPPLGGVHEPLRERISEEPVGALRFSCPCLGDQYRGQPDPVRCRHGTPARSVQCLRSGRSATTCFITSVDVMCCTPGSVARCSS